ncbi:hypothetical protein FQR65_LT00520 [Abscondita terminalis]|nr:hypothetical protein FQR65_LT00520 [Abscondita terminalis]
MQVLLVCGNIVGVVVLLYTDHKAKKYMFRGLKMLHMLDRRELDQTLTVLNPFHTPDAAAVQDTDLAGPLVFCMAFGAFLLLSGKVHFSYIYGFGVLGCLFVWTLLSLMSAQGVTVGTVITVLGYCLLPMVILSGVNVVYSLQGYVGTILTILSIFWCSLSASKLFVTALAMDHQQPLVLYPCALLYGVFALITIF